MTGSVSHANEGFAEKAIAYSRDVYCGHGKIEILPKVGASSLEDMAVAYTPGVAHVVQHVLASPDKLDEVTARGNMIALVTDGTAVLGLGDVGPKAAIPVMEGKAVMFKCLAGIDCMPLCLDAKGIDRFCDTICALEPSFSGINIEDVASPHCFEIVSQLEERLSIPVLHDDQFGTATVVTAAVINSLKLTGKKTKDVTVVVNGVGAAGTASIRMLEALGVGNIIAVDKKGILDPGDRGLPRHFREIASRTNAGSVSGKLCDAMRGADCFVGLSTGGIVDENMVRSMSKDPVVLALANPEPEIRPDKAMAAGAAVTASGRFDYPNHCNNVLAFPGLMRGALVSKARRIDIRMCLAAAHKIAQLGEPVRADHILPSPLDLNVHAAVADAVAAEAVAVGLARADVTPGYAGRTSQEFSRHAINHVASLPKL